MYGCVAGVQWLVAGVLVASLLVGGRAKAEEVPKEAPISITFVEGEGDVSLSRYEEDAERVRFVVEAGVPVRLRVRPEAFAVAAGREYSVNASYYDPWLMRAERDGELVLELDTPRNCTIVIEDARGGNLAPNPSFEEAGGWVTEMEEGPTGVAASADDPSGVSGPAEGVSRTGERSFKLSVGRGQASVQLTMAEGVAVEGGKTYLVSAYYHLEGARHGSTLQFRAEVSAPGQDTLYASDNFLRPLILETPGGWRRTFFTFAVPEDWDGASEAGRARVMLVMTASGRPFDVYWDDVEVRVAPSAAPQYAGEISAEKARPRYSAEEVREMMAVRPPVKVEPPIIGERPLRVNGKPVHLFAYASQPDWMAWPRLSPHEDFLQAGVRLHFIPAMATGGWMHEEPLWLDDGVFDFAPLEKKLTTMLGYDPEACVLLYLGPGPYPAFGDKHPEARWVNAFGQQTVGAKESWRAATERKPRESWNISYTAEAYRRETSRFLRALGEFLATSDVGKAVVGVHLAGGTDGQWFVHGWGREFGQFDHSEGSVKAFREWLSRRYGGDVEEFREAWGDEALTFETATMPAEAERSPERYFLDPSDGSDRRVIDANLFEQEGVVETINLFGRAFKEGIGRESLVFTYYPKKHYALRVLLEEPYVDGVVGVMEYGLWRTLGHTGHNDSSPASLRLHNKIFLTEMDFRTEYSNSWGTDANKFRKEIVMTKTPEEAANQVRRDLGNSLAQFEGGWIYGLPGYSWVGDEHLAYIEEACKAAMLAATDPMPDDRGQMAVFMDEQIRAHGSERYIWGSLMHYMANYIPRTTLNRTGLSWDDYVLTDLENPKRADYRINVFTTAASMRPEQIAWVKENLQKDGHVLVFVNGAGFCYGDGFEANIRELAGMTVKVDLEDHEDRRFVAVGDDPLSEGVEDLLSGYAGPTFYVDDPTATPLAMLTGTEKVGLAVKRFEGWTSVYISLLGGFTPKLLRNLAEEAGVTPIGPEDDVTYAGNGFVVIHALTSGEKTVRWTGESDLFDLALGETVARGVESYTFPMKATETRWFRRVPAAPGGGVRAHGAEPHSAEPHSGQPHGTEG